MSIVEKGLTTSGVAIDERNYPVDNPSKRKFAKVIKAIREAESLVSEEERAVRADRDHWRERALEAEALNRKHALQKAADECNLTTADTRKLLVAADVEVEVEAAAS